jgi:Ni/Fe-hydrogenase subunit HybB-like protein
VSAADFESDRAVTDALVAPVTDHLRAWWRLAAVAGAAAFLLPLSALYTVVTGIGTWGDRVPVGWGLSIVHFVWWVGIGHAGTFLSAILLVARQAWRSSIHRIAETMTLFAIMQAGLFPLLHLGRAWFFYWTLPYPATTGVWPQFSSALTWDVVAISVYLTVSILFWYVGLVPDLASRRDRSHGRAGVAYAVLALGWRGSARHWQHHRQAQVLLAGLATPLVVSVHSIVSLDFASGVLPGWASPIFPPYFVCGAIYSGLAMVITIVVPLRRWLSIERAVDTDLLDRLALVMLAMGLAVTYSYLAEAYTVATAGDAAEQRMTFEVRPFGAHAPIYWAMLACNALAPQILWWRRARRSPIVLFGVALAVDFGMWAERLVLITTSQERDFLPSSFRDWLPSPVDVALLVGTLGFFSLAFLFAIRWFPVLAMSEIKEQRHAREPEPEAAPQEVSRA